MIALVRKPYSSDMADDKDPWSVESDGTLSVLDMAERTGLTVELLQEVRVASGLEPVDVDQPVYVEGDLEAFRLLGFAADLFSWREAIGFVRVVGSSVSRITDAANTMFIENVERPVLRAGGTEDDLQEQVTVARDLADQLSSVMRMMLRLHLAQSIARHRRAWADQPQGGDLSPMAVGFVDLVGFTSRSLRLSASELADLVSRFERTANDTITVNRGRLVKMIGDEVMFVAATAADGCTIAESLLRRFGEEPDLTPRGGMAYGPVLTRAGDFFGPIVNLAARLVDQAVPGEVLLSTEAATGASRPLPAAGRRMLKGFDDPVAVVSLSLD